MSQKCCWDWLLLSLMCLYQVRGNVVRCDDVRNSEFVGRRVNVTVFTYGGRDVVLVVTFFIYCIKKSSCTVLKKLEPGKIFHLSSIKLRFCSSAIMEQNQSIFYFFSSILVVWFHWFVQLCRGYVIKHTNQTNEGNKKIEKSTIIK